MHFLDARIAATIGEGDRAQRSVNQAVAMGGEPYRFLALKDPAIQALGLDVPRVP